jgi:pimeloyl-ACP methyl ester carboxylesterase
MSGFICAAEPVRHSTHRPIAMPLLQLHGADDGCFLPPQVDDRHRFAAPHTLEVVPDVGHFLHIEAPEAIAERIAAWAE